MRTDPRIKIPSTQKADALIDRETRHVRYLVAQAGKAIGQTRDRRGYKRAIESLRGQITTLNGQVAEMRGLLSALSARVEGC